MKTVIVAGITRSGLTMTMQLLDAGGYPCIGTYPMYENEGFLADWKDDWKGNAIKLVDTHLLIPQPGEYSVIMLQRNRKEQTKSMIQFLKLSNMPVTKAQKIHLRKTLDRDYPIIYKWVKQQKEVLHITFEDIINEPVVISSMIAKFVDQPLNKTAMANRVVKRSTDCHKGLLELTFLEK